MSELIFILIVLYAAYVVKKSCGEKEHTELDFLGGNEEASKEEVKAPPVEKVKEPAPVVEEKTALEKPVVKEAKPEPVKTPITPLSNGEKMPVGSLSDPETGEQVKLANSYRMSKRWIKEALVTEGLLDKVYKVSEIDDAKKIEINLAFEQLLEMDKYK